MTREAARHRDTDLGRASGDEAVEVRSARDAVVGAQDGELAAVVGDRAAAPVRGHRRPALPALLRMMVERDLDATGVQVHRPTLDDVFLTMTGRSLRDEAASPTDRAAA